MFGLVYNYSLCYQAWMISLYSVFYPTNDTTTRGEMGAKKLQDMLVIRAKAALEDAVKFIEKEKPDWLC
jgi:hypothetical protein